MTLQLPATPKVSAGTPRPVDGGSWQTPIAGGTSIRIERPNATHMAVDFATPPIQLTGLARQWMSRLLQAVRQPVRVPFPQPEITVGNPGATVVDGAGQSGYSVALRGGAPGYTVLEGQGLNVFDVSGRPYLHICSADTVIGGDGRAAVPVEPRLRAGASDGSQISFVPVIEGRLIGADKGITLKRLRADGVQFTVEELK